MPTCSLQQTVTGRECRCISCGNRDGDFDNAVIVHEYIHGLSIRLTGGAGTSSCLNNQEQMGEGWSDYYGLMFTMRASDTRTDARGIGTWLFGQPPTGPGIRPYPYSTDFAVNPQTYDDVKIWSVPHGVGSVWCTMLWEMTWDLIDDYGFDPDFKNGTGGNNIALALVTEALKLQPCSPGFVDGRDAILLADQILYGGQNECTIWEAFARRGLGVNADQGSTFSRSDGTEDFTEPTICSVMPPMGGADTCYDFTGGQQEFVVPDGVTEITIEAWGAQGNSNAGGISGGEGGYSTGTLAVTPGETIYVYVGGGGQISTSGGFNGGGNAGTVGCPQAFGGGGGGASDIRQGGTALANRVIIAGGGGGAGGQRVQGCGRGTGGGGGAGYYGGGGGAAWPFASTTLPTGGTQASGGIGGTSTYTGAPNNNGTAGSLGTGGTGGDEVTSSQGGNGTALPGGSGGGTTGGDGQYSVNWTGQSGAGGSGYIGGVTAGSTMSGGNVGEGMVCISFATTGDLMIVECAPDTTVDCDQDTSSMNLGIPVVTGGCAGMFMPATTGTEVLRLVATDAGNRCGLSYNVTLDRYYTARAGNPTFMLDCFDGSGSLISSTTAGISYRGMWWNPNAGFGESEGNGFSEGVVRTNLSGDCPDGTVTNIFPDNKPNAQSCGDLDFDNNEIIYYDGLQIYPVDRATGLSNPTLALSGIPAGSSYSLYAVGYTGVPGHEYAIFDKTTTSVHLYDRATGAFAASVPVSTLANDFGFTYENGIAWVFDNATTTWVGYEIFTSSGGGSLMFSYVDAITPGGCPQEYTIERTWTVADACQNEVTCLQTIIVQDTTAPTITCPPTATVSCDASTAPANTGTPTATDNCDDNVTTFSFTDSTIPGACPQERTILRTWTATDACGNTSETCVQTINVVDNVGPVVTCVPTLTVELDENGEYMFTPEELYSDVTDNCGSSFTFVINPPIVTCGEVGMIAVTIAGIDECGNQGATCTVNVNVEDNTPPILTCPSSEEFYLGADQCDRIIVFDEPTATDECDQEGVVGSLTTLFAANNGQAGNMFNITNLGAGALPITMFDLNIDPGTHTFRLYFSPGGFAGKETNAGAWTQVGELLITSNGFNQPTPFPLGFTIPAGETYGVYITEIGGTAINYTNGGPSTFTDGVIEITTGPGTFGLFGGTFFPRQWNGTVYYELPPRVTTVERLDTNGYVSGDLFPIGEHCFRYRATDSNGNTSECEWCFTVIDYQDPVQTLQCNNRITLGLDATCMIDLNADMILEGGPYGCPDRYPVVVRDDRGNIMDLDGDPTNGTQLGAPHIGKCFEVQVTHPDNGVKCWGTVCIEDKLPPVIADCPDVTVTCEQSTDPGAVPVPTALDACDPILETSYVDWVTDGSCAEGFERIISRRWTFTDDYGNSATCEQTIRVELIGLLDVAVPGNFDDLSNPALECDEKYDASKDVSGHILDAPFCVDGYLLDSALWLATGGDPALGDLSGDRLPMTLGWNCIENGPYAGHPSPFGIYYEPHPQWELLGLCWGPNQVVQWIGTGLPSGASCSNIEYTFADTKIDLNDPTCSAGEVGCYKILRQWTLIDWCTGEVGGHDQIIKVLDKKAPEIVVPDRLEVGTDVWKCEGVVQVPAPWITDNCSEDLDYSVTVKTGQVIGNSATGYTVVGLALGEHTLYIEAFDCCGNTGLDSIILDVVDNTPPVCISEDRVQLSLAGNQSPGTNYSSICAEELDQASYDNCTDWIWFKMIRMDELLGTVNGSFAPNDVACGGINGDDDALISGNQVYFDDCSKFCCEDADQIIMVVLRVHDVDPGAGPVNPLRYTPPGGDLVGHFTDCWVEVDVRDKAQPIVVAPPDMVVSCMFWFDDSEDALEDINNPTFGRVVTSLADREKVKTIDVVCEEWCEDHPKYDYEPSRDRPAIWRQACDFYDLYYDVAHPDDKYELVWGFDGYAIRTCGAQPTIRVDDRRECGQGVINRDVIVSFQDPKTGGVVTYRDRQEIWVIDCDPFFVSEDCFDDEDCIDWPLFCQQPDPIDGCGADLDPYTNPDLGFPVVQNGCDDNCALIVVEYNDEILTVEPDACFKVIRTWVIIDWCQYDPLMGRDDDGDNPNQVAEGRWEYIQVINVRDKIDPVVSVEVGDCEPAVKDTATGICLGRLEICATATDECSPDDWLVYDYKIDAFSDGVGQFGDFDFYVGKLTLKQFNDGTSLTQGPLDCDAYNQGGYCNPFAEDPTQPFCATGTYPVGVHTIYWFAEDGCGNVVKDTTVFEILDCKAPTPYCKTGIISVVMPVNGEICIWASDLDDGSFDNCTDAENLKFYFNGDTSMTEYCINCDTFEARGADDKVLIDVQVWVEDEEGNTDFCVTTIEIQDNQDVCDNSGSIISGNVENAMMQDMVEYVEMSLNGGMMVDITDRDGEYAFTGWEMNKDYTVSAYRNDDPLNGVSTKDLVAIQRHLLGHSPFVSGYQMIAADVNNNADVSAADISALRRVILGTAADFSQYNGQTSWRFVDANENLTDNTDPWPFTEELNYTDVATNMYAVDFDAVKVGDVTGDAESNGAVSNSTRSNGQLILAVEDADIVAGDSYVMEVTSENFDAIAGYQFTMKYDANALSFAGINSGAITVTEGNLGLQGLADGVITMSWNDANGQATTVTDGEVLFTITFDAAVNAKASDIIRATSDITRAEAYGADLDDRGLTIEFRNGNRVVEVFELYQNTPNPFDATTVISYTLPQDMPAVLTVYDVAGKVVLVKEVSGEKGYNEVELSKAQLNGAGVLYYQLDAADYTATKRMVLID